jgi:SAM-dependent methyltransferase
MTKTDISTRYFEEEEVRSNPNPYEDYFYVLNNTFNLSGIGSFLDVGCATGWLLFFLRKNFPLMNLSGLEYFEYHKNAADPTVREEIQINDIRDPLNLGERYDIVNSTEVGEHIDPSYTEVFLDNLKRHCSKYLVVSWGDTGGVNDRKRDPHLQHLNPLPYHEVITFFQDHGFTLDKEKTKRMRYFSHRAPKIKMSPGIIPVLKKLIGINYPQTDGFYPWWRKSLSVWKTS